MKLKIRHQTTYDYAQPVALGLQEIRLTPKSRAGQSIISWNVDLDGAVRQAEFDDQHNNQVIMSSIENAERISITCEGEVETTNGSGVIGEHGGFAPLWYFRRQTDLTNAGTQCNLLLKELGDGHENDLAKLHSLADLIASKVSYQVNTSHSRTTAEQALAGGQGVCQDHAHIFLAAARGLGIPARYVSGYLMMDDRVDQDATHAWAEAHVDGLGWVGFDVSNGISPDERYVRVATGLDYREAAPVFGMNFSTSHADQVESMVVELQVQQ